jgi:hypothetical protein
VVQESILRISVSVENLSAIFSPSNFGQISIQKTNDDTGFEGILKPLKIITITNLEMTYRGSRCGSEVK